MKNIYKRSGIYRWLAMLLMACLSLPIQAQLTAPPIIQWQKTIEGGIDANSRVRLAKTSTGEFAVLNGSGLSYITAVGTLKSSAAVEGSVLINPSGPEYSKVQKTFGLVSTTDGGVIVLASDASNVYIIKKDANQNRVWSTILAPNTNSSNTEFYTGFDILPASDGNYMVFAIHGLADNLGNVTAIKVNTAGTVVWSKDVFSQQAVSPTGLVSRGFSKITTASDGGYLLSGRTLSPLSRPRPNPGLAAKIDAQANLTWSRLYDPIVDFNDLLANPYEPGTFLVLGINDPSYGGSYNGPTYPYKMQSDGSVTRLGNFTLNALSRISSDGSGQPYYVVVEGIDQNNGDLTFTGFNQQNQAVWGKVLGGSGADIPHALLTTGDGYLLGGTTTSTDGDIKGKQGNALATWVVKFSKTATPLVQTAPTYNCQTGAITFNVSGGDGTPVSYIAPGITRASVTDNFGVVEPGLRGDPKVIAITAIQSGASATYNFDLKAACSSTPTPMPKPPVLIEPIPDLNLTVGQSANFPIGSRIVDPTTGIPGYAPNWSYSVEGLTIPYLSAFARPTDLMYSSVLPVSIVGQAVQSGVINVTLTARTAAFPNNPVITTFRIIVAPYVPPTDGPLTLLAPLYECATGAITFRTSGGNGSPIEYQAPGITGWTSNPNQFVDRESRTANDVQPFMLMARQSGNVVTYVWDLKAACGRARVGTGEPAIGLQVRVLGNPVVGQTAELEITGVTGQRVQLNLVDKQGRSLQQQTIDQAEPVETVRVPVGRSSGLFLLQVTTSQEHKTIKLLKH